MRSALRYLISLVFLLATSSVGPAAAQSPTTAQSYGIAAKRPVFAGACKACPWGMLAEVTARALKPYGYDVQICNACATTYGPRLMADKLKPKPAAAGAADPLRDPVPDAVPDIGATSEINLVAGWTGTGDFAKDHKTRQNYRIIAAIQQPNYLVTAASRKSGITDLSQVKNRTQPTWVYIDNNDATADILAYYGITDEGLKAKGGGILKTSDREKRAAADVFIANGLLVDTPEQRVWYEVSQLNDLVFFAMDDALLAKLAQRPGYVRGTMPLAIFRGVDRPIPTVMRSVHYIYVRDDAPDAFAYTVAKALDEHQDLFRTQAGPWYYDPKVVAYSTLIPLHPGALKYYRERGYLR